MARNATFAFNSTVAFAAEPSATLQYASTQQNTYKKGGVFPFLSQPFF